MLVKVKLLLTKRYNLETEVVKQIKIKLKELCNEHKMAFVIEDGSWFFEHESGETFDVCDLHNESKEEADVHEDIYEFMDELEWVENEHRIQVFSELVTYISPAWNEQKEDPDET